MSAADPRVITITAEAPALPVFGVRPVLVGEVPLPSGVARTRKQLAGSIIQAAGYTSSRRPLLGAGILFGKAAHGCFLTARWGPSHRHQISGAR